MKSDLLCIFLFFFRSSRRLFFTDWSESPRLVSLNLDGSDLQVLADATNGLEVANGKYRDLPGMRPL